MYKFRGKQLHDSGVLRKRGLDQEEIAVLSKDNLAVYAIQQTQLIGSSTRQVRALALINVESRSPNVVHRHLVGPRRSLRDRCLAKDVNEIARHSARCMAQLGKDARIVHSFVQYILRESIDSQIPDLRDRDPYVTLQQCHEKFR